jgi:DNA-binding response OmpR family regulator
MASLLLLSNDTKLENKLRTNLIKVGHQFESFKSIYLALERCKSISCDLCIIDVSSFGSDGFKMIQFIRQNNRHLPLLFLLSKEMFSDKNIGFQHDADDCLLLPLDMDDFAFHVQLLLNKKDREIQSEYVSNHALQIGSYSFSPDSRSLTNGQKVITLTKKEATVLNLLHAHRNRLLRREKILIKAWGKVDYFMGRSMDVYITRLRNYLKDDNSVCIKNIHGIGYVLTVDEKKNE